MPPRNPELPEGTDHIINGAMETGAGTSASTGSSGAASGSSGGGATGGGSGGGGGGSGGSSNDSGGALIGSGASGDDTGGNATGSGGDIKQQLLDGAQSLRSQATDKFRSFASDGKERATTMLDDFAQVVGDAAASIDERLGSEYGEYARRAAGAVSGYADSLRAKDVDELYEDVSNIVRKSPVVAIGTAAAIGFALVRLVKAGMDSAGQGSDSSEGSPGGTGGGKRGGGSCGSGGSGSGAGA